MNILIAISHKKLRNTLSFALESQLGVTVMTAGTAGEAIATIVRGTPYHLILMDHPVIAEPLIAFIKSVQNKAKLGIVLPGTLTAPIQYASLTDVEFFGRLAGDELLDSLLNFARKVRGDVMGEDPVGEHIPETEFCRIPPGLLNGGSALSADIYIRLGPSKYLKVVHANEIFSPSDYQKYFEEKSVDFLYVKHASTAALVEHFKKSLLEKMSEASTKPDSVLKVAGDVAAATHELISRVGITPEVRSLIKQNILLTVKTLAANPRLKMILSKISADKKTYLSSHSMALAQLSCSIAASLDWESEATFEKLTMASFLHDIVLTDQELAKVQTNKELEALSAVYSREEIKEYTHHPSRSAAIAMQFEEILPDVENVISQHHERPDGSGFPRGLNKTQISPLSSLFIVAHDLLSSMIASPGSFSVKEFLSDREELYSAGSFKKIFVILSKMGG